MTHPLDRQYVIEALRAAVLRSQLLTSEIEMIATAVRGGLVSPEAGLMWVRDIGGLSLVGCDDSEFDAMDALEAVP